MWHTPFLCSLFTCVLLIMFPMPSAAEEKFVAGWLEKAKIYPGGLLIHAKLDTGAKTTSLNIKNLETFEKNQQLWVRFQVVSRKERVRTFERKVTRRVKIKRHGADPLERYVVKLGVCVGKLYKEVEVNLADRSDFNYQLLIGRTYLQSNILVDASETYTLKLDCKDAKKS